MTNDTVKCWAEPLTIPTYPIGERDKNPMFLEKRIYQGSSGVVYPHAVIDKVLDEKVDREYTAVFLENRYLKIMILPEIGGRVQMALDKTNNYHFVYYNQVIKPALVGLTGPWISGGIEFNWPQHHRPSTFDPLDWRIEEDADGSKTIWCAEIEKMFRTKGMHGFTLHPDRAYLEIKAQLYNRTAEPQTFLWWANPAVHVNDDYQSIFPPDVHAVMDHGKRDVSDFPIATGTYYKKDYSPGTDISRYKNIPVPTSYMAYHSDFDFVGCYDHGKQAGMMHVANHHVVPGKKQWTWGNSDFGQAWDRQLTDEDGPYIELMCGAYTDNQPDFSWIQPGEEKSFTQIFMPYKAIGLAKNASKDAVVNLEVDGDQAQIGVYVSRPHAVQVLLRLDGYPIFDKTIALSPEKTLAETVTLPAGTKPQALTLSIIAENETLISFTPLPEDNKAIPDPATPVLPPEEITSNEELFLSGLHLEQYRHATYRPEPYYEEVLRRDPGDSRCNNALGLLLYRNGKFAAAEPYFRTAIKRLIGRNPNPYNSEPFYNLGLSLKMQGRFQEAFDAFYKAIWSAEWQSPAYFELAKLASRAGKLHEARELAERCLNGNNRHHKARHLTIALLRKLGQKEQAISLAAESLALDSLEYGAIWEKHLLTGEKLFDQNVKFDPDTSLELAIDYTQFGFFLDAVALLKNAPDSDPLVNYTLGWIYEQMEDRDNAVQAFKSAAACQPDYCFPNRLEDVLSLSAAMRQNPTDSRAPYYLGNFWYAHRRYTEAIECWEQARDLDALFPTVHRNLGLAYFNKRNDAVQALQSLETAFELNPADARVLFELDQLYKKLNRAPHKRLAFLEQHLPLVNQRDDLTIERITLLNLLHKPEEAFDILCKRNFHPWEGGEGRVTGQYVTSLVEMARRFIAKGEHLRAIEKLQQAQSYPHNLGEGKLYGAQENNIFYYLGVAHAGLNEQGQAQGYFAQAAVGLSEPSSAVFYNDQPPDMIFYQGLARQKLGQQSEATELFEKLIAYGRNHIHDDVSIDYFAVSLPNFMVFDEDLNLQNQLHCHYMMALGSTGLATGLFNEDTAASHYTKILNLNAYHLGAVLHQSLLNK
ncbi:MAG: tetratricopeptide (TPR) repeat protein [Cellvibrionaceae bacterium]|jgi:tetratricopeptide (TPR) repeat protein